MAPDNWMASCDITELLVAALRGQEEFQTANHSAYLQEGIAEVRKQGVLQAEEALAETLKVPPVQDTYLFQREKKTGAWLTVQPSTVNGMKLGMQ